MKYIVLILVLFVALQGAGQEVEHATMFSNNDILITSSGLHEGFNFECYHDRQTYHLGVYDGDGEIVTEQVVKDNSKGSFDFANMESGSYYIKIYKVNTDDEYKLVFSRSFLMK